jgi:hypothetical protein
VTDTLIRLPATPGHRFWAETATSPPDWWFVVQVDHFLGPNYVSAHGGSLTWRSAVTEALRELPEPPPKVPQQPAPVVRVTAIQRAVEPLPGADGPADTGMRLRPRYPSTVLAQAVGALADAGVVVRDDWFAAAVDQSTLHEAFGEVWSGPEARALAHQILDDCPGQCDADRDCRMGAEHECPHLWRQDGWRD